MARKEKVEPVIGKGAEIAKVGDVELGSVGTDRSQMHIEGAIEVFQLFEIGTPGKGMPSHAVKESPLNSGMVENHLPQGIHAAKGVALHSTIGKHDK